MQDFGSVEELLTRTDELKGKLKESISAAGDQLALNKELAELNTDVDVDLEPEDAVMGEWDLEAVRRLFTSLEFRTLFDRLEEVGRSAKPAVEVAELDLRKVDVTEAVALVAADGPKAIRLDLEDREVRGVAVSVGGGQAAFADVQDLEAFAAALGQDEVPKWIHDAKDLETAVVAEGGSLEGVRTDTMLAAYLLDPAAPSFELQPLSEQYLGTDVLGSVAEEAEGQLFGEAWRRTAAEAAAVALLAPVLDERIDKAGLRRLLDEVELPLSSVLARMQANGVALDVAYLEEMAEGVRDTMATLQVRIYDLAGEEFNLNSPPQLRAILYDKLQLSPGKKTPKGQLSTDASVLEKLRDVHPIVDAILSWRELDKLNSTYLDALPKQVDPRDGRVHTTFNQTGAATGRLSSTNPNLQNIPVRGELGRQIRRAFVPGSKGDVLLVADYSQIELRILAHLSDDEGLKAAFESGADIHTATSARVFGLPEDQVDPATRSRAKAINYGLAYGMNAWGWRRGWRSRPTRRRSSSTRTSRASRRSATSWTARSRARRPRGSPRRCSGAAATSPSCRRPTPGAGHGPPDGAERADPGSAADVFKLGMIGVDAALRGSDLECRMLLTVHDELVFEVSERRVEQAADLVKREMEAAYELDVPLRADIGWGANWAEAVPAGH